MSTMHTHISLMATTVWCDTGGIKNITLGIVVNSPLEAMLWLCYYYNNNMSKM